MDLLAADGFVFVPERCDAAWVDRVLEVSRRGARAAQEALGSREIGIGSAAGYVEIVQRSPGRWDVPIGLAQFDMDDRQMPWWPVVAAALGEDAELTCSGVVFSDPGSPAQHWHADSPHLAAEHLSPHAVNVLVALHDVPLAMGPTECARGSHVLTNHLANPSLVVDELVYQHAGTSPETLVAGTGHPVPEAVAGPMVAGACLVFDDRLLHRGLANRSDEIRHVAYFTYCRKGHTLEAYFESERSVHGS